MKAFGYDIERVMWEEFVLIGPVAGRAGLPQGFAFGRGCFGRESR